MAITEKICQRIECKKKFYGSKNRKYCCDYCRLAVWRKSNKQSKDDKDE